MGPTTYIFDLETKRLAQEVGGWAHIDKLGLSAAVMLEVETSRVFKFVEDQAGQLIDRINNAERMVGYNIIRFDYEVLRPYGLYKKPDLIDRTLDLMNQIYQFLGYRVSLQALAETTLGESKSADGIAAVEWFREGNIDKVLAYCEQDVKVTYRLWEYGRERGYVLFRDRNNRINQVPVEW
jgi:DEAD/DEAH box helicase domain-containing protein